MHLVCYTDTMDIFISSMFDGLQEEWKKMLCRDVKEEFATIVKKIHADQICPPARDIFNAFRECPYEQTRVVLIGQDPFIRPGEAMGMSFSVRRGIKVPPSTVNIYKCLHARNLIPAVPKCGDLTHWARQGVLLLNSALTTRLGTSNAHKTVWASYTDNLIARLSATLPNLVYILLGGDAQKKRAHIRSSAAILEWGHPSPLNAQNKVDGPENFRNCTVFEQANAALIRLGHPPIDWRVDPESSAVDKPVVIAPEEPGDKIIVRTRVDDDPMPPQMDETVWLFTDGASRANGRANCRASWGFHLTDGKQVVEAANLVQIVDIPGKVYSTSNNRGELMAIHRGLKYIADNLATLACSRVYVVSDSQYAITCLQSYVDRWMSKGDIDTKANIDIIVPIKKIMDGLNADMTDGVLFRHVNSHKKAPTDPLEYFLWKGNARADELCTGILA